ncbi:MULTISPECIES: putative quinol monooxygenase [unclassified Sphingomonas]|uniref:putative quinol monooxygenase n=1 Tax=Novosphingobium rhizosphaerae TaxID=1551649 RepID=UPI0015CE22DD
MILVMGTFRLPTASFEAAAPLMRKVIEATRAEDGCLAYAYSHDALDPELIHVSEQWSDRAAIDAHFKTAHMATWAEERKALGLSERNIRVYESDEGVAV